MSGSVQICTVSQGVLNIGMVSKSHGWDVRNMAKISPKMVKKQPFFDFFRISQKLKNHMIRTKFSTIILHHNAVLFVQFKKNCMTGVRGSQKEKDLSGLVHRMCGSGFFSQWNF